MTQGAKQLFAHLDAASASTAGSQAADRTAPRLSVNRVTRHDTSHGRRSVLDPFETLGSRERRFEKRVNRPIMKNGMDRARYAPSVSWKRRRVWIRGQAQHLLSLGSRGGEPPYRLRRVRNDLNTAFRHRSQPDCRHRAVTPARRSFWRITVLHSRRSACQPKDYAADDRGAAGIGEAPGSDNGGVLSGFCTSAAQIRNRNNRTRSENANNGRAVGGCDHADACTSSERRTLNGASA